MAKPMHLIGNRYGNLIVQSLDDTRTNNGECRWKCLCECGNFIILPTSKLTIQQRKDCGCIKQQYIAKGMPIKRQLYIRYRKDAKVRGYIFNISFILFLQLTQKNCYYCDVEPNQNFRISKNGEIYKYNGLDRVDNTKGYSDDNVVPCCIICNSAKGKRSQIDFLNWVDRVSNHTKMKG